MINQIPLKQKKLSKSVDKSNVTFENQIIREINSKITKCLNDIDTKSMYNQFCQLKASVIEELCKKTDCSVKITKSEEFDIIGDILIDFFSKCLGFVEDQKKNLFIEINPNLKKIDTILKLNVSQIERFENLKISQNLTNNIKEFLNVSGSNILKLKDINQSFSDKMQEINTKLNEIKIPSNSINSKLKAQNQNIQIPKISEIADKINQIKELSRESDFIIFYLDQNINSLKDDIDKNLKTESDQKSSEIGKNLNDCFQNLKNPGRNPQVVDKIVKSQGNNTISENIPYSKSHSTLGLKPFSSKVIINTDEISTLTDQDSNKPNSKKDLKIMKENEEKKNSWISSQIIVRNTENSGSENEESFISALLKFVLELDLFVNNSKGNLISVREFKQKFEKRKENIIESLKKHLESEEVFPKLKTYTSPNQEILIQKSSELEFLGQNALDPIKKSLKENCLEENLNSDLLEIRIQNKQNKVDIETIQKELKIIQFDLKTTDDDLSSFEEFCRLMEETYTKLQNKINEEKIPISNIQRNKKIESNSSQLKIDAIFNIFSTILDFLVNLVSKINGHQNEKIEINLGLITEMLKELKFMNSENDNRTISIKLESLLSEEFSKIEKFFLNLLVKNSNIMTIHSIDLIIDSFNFWIDNTPPEINIENFLRLQLEKQEQIIELLKEQHNEELNSLKSKIFQKDIQINDMKIKTNILQRNIKFNSFPPKQDEFQHNQIDNQKEFESSLLKELEKDIIVKDSNYQKLQKEYLDLQNNLDEKNSKINDFTNQIKIMRLRLNEQVFINSEIKNELGKLKIENSILKSDLNVFQKNLINVHNQISEIYKKNSVHFEEELKFYKNPLKIQENPTSEIKELNSELFSEIIKSIDVMFEKNFKLYPLNKMEMDEFNSKKASFEETIKEGKINFLQLNDEFQNTLAEELNEKFAELIYTERFEKLFSIINDYSQETVRRIEEYTESIFQKFEEINENYISTDYIDFSQFSVYQEVKILNYTFSLLIRNKFDISPQKISKKDFKWVIQDPDIKEQIGNCFNLNFSEIDSLKIESQNILTENKRLKSEIEEIRNNSKKMNSEKLDLIIHENKLLQKLNFELKSHNETLQNEYEKIKLIIHDSIQTKNKNQTKVKKLLLKKKVIDNYDEIANLYIESVKGETNSKLMKQNVHSIFIDSRGKNNKVLAETSFCEQSEDIERIFKEKYLKLTKEISELNNIKINLQNQFAEAMNKNEEKKAQMVNQLKIYLIYLTNEIFISPKIKDLFSIIFKTLEFSDEEINEFFKNKEQKKKTFFSGLFKNK